MLLTEMFGAGAWAPDINPADTVMTPRGKGVVIDARQNRDGHYIFFTVELLDGPHDGERSDFNIDELSLLPSAPVTGYLNDAPEPGQNFSDKA